MNRFIALIFLLIAAPSVQAVEQTVKVINTGYGLLNDIDLSTDQRPFMLADPTNWHQDFAFQKVANEVVFGIDEAIATVDPDFYYRLTFDLAYETWDDGLNAFVTVTEPGKVLLVDYQTAGSYQDREVYFFEAGHRVQITNISIASSTDGIAYTTLTGPDRENLFLEVNITTEFYTQFNRNFVPATALTIAQTSSDFVVSWPYVEGAEHYDFEWAWVSGYAGTFSGGGIPDVIPATAAEYDFNANASRVRVSENQYHVPKVYGDGYLVFRYRGVGVSIPDGERLLEGQWSTSGSGTVAALTGAFTPVVAHTGNAKNYAAQLGFVEEGTQGLSIAYSDGVGKARQSVSRLNSQEKLMVGSTIYDYYGRPAIAVMGSPVDQSSLNYVEELNMLNATTPYDKAVFATDLGLSGDCGSAAAPAMSEADSKGAAHYYSDQNPDKEGANAYLPDADGYAFSQIHYANDPTGRVRRAGNLGATFQLTNGGHYTETMYGRPSEDEVDALFGSEAVDWTNYTKVVTRDPNGQISGKILDGYGRTIATFLEGDAPVGLMALETNTGVSTLETSDLSGLNSTSTTLLDQGILELEYKVMVTDPSKVYTFDYDFTQLSYTSTCLPAEVCFDCVYEVRFEVTPAEGEFTEDCKLTDGLSDGLIPSSWSYTLGNITGYDITCGTPLQFSEEHPGTFTLQFPRFGEYYVKKTLQVSDHPVEDYWNEYVANADENCLNTYSDFWEAELATLDFTACEEGSACLMNFLSEYGTWAQYSASTGITDEGFYNKERQLYIEDCENQPVCAQVRPFLLADVRPGGQYGATGGTDPTSVFYEAGSTEDWRDVTFYEFDGTTPSQLTNSSGALVAANDPSISLATFVDNWQDQWAESLLPLHPEYWTYQFCAQYSTVFKFEKGMRTTDTWSAALAAGYLSPANASSYSCFDHPLATTSYDPLIQLFETPAFVAWLTGRNYIYDDPATDVAITNYRHAAFFVLNSRTLTGEQTLYEVAAAQADGLPFGTSTCDLDAHWKAFRSVYLARRNILLQIMMEGYALNQLTPAHPNQKVRCIEESFTGCADYSAKLKRFPLFDQVTGSTFATLITNYNGALTDLSADAIANIDSYCAAECATHADLWMATLAGCAGSMGLAPGETWAPGQPTYDSVLDDLLTVCRGGCDEEWPFPDQYNNNPSPTPAHATSFQAVLEHYLGGSETITCNHLLINYPAPIPDQRLGNYLSTCGCDQLLSVDNEADFEAAFGAVPANFCKDRQACADAKALNPNLTYPLGSLTWTTAEVAQLESTIASAQYLCKENCLDCKDYFDLVGAFNSRFGTADISEQPTLFTNFVNAALGTNFTFASLEQFDQDCRYGKVTTGLAPEIEEYVALFNQLLPGGLLHTQSHTATTLPGLYNHSFYSFSELAVYDYIPIYLGSGSLRINFRSLTPDGCPGGEVVHLTPENLAGYSSASEVLANVQAFTLAYLTGVDLASGPPIEQHHLTALVTGADGVVVEVPIEVTYTCLTTHGGGVALLCENLNLAENDETNCIEGMLSSAEYAAEYAYAQYLATEKEAFIASYTAACVGVAESFTESHNNNQYHYTLFYFDRAGNLSKTVPPEGVNKLSAAQVEELQTFRETNNLVPGSAPHYPTHGGFETTYQYNSMGQPTQSITPDGDTTRMWYDDLGRLTVSQNARQRDFTSNLLVEDPYGPGHGLYAHNYMEYDHLGRMVEAGELIHPQQMVYATAKDPVALAAWKNQASASGAEVVKNRVVKTYYTDPPTATIVSEFEGNSAGDLRNRIAYITVNEGYHYQDGSSLPSPDYGYYYAYDIHGNVAEALQQTKALAADGREFFHSEYAYDLLSGLTHQVDFQKGEVDQFTHRYHYDADNRLKEVWTTKDGHIWDRDADYQYREDGHLARTELGEMKVQGCDFAYTLRGWLKGMNSGVLHPEKDMGKDGALAGADYLSSAPGLHDDIAQDVYGFTISYFEGDYKSIESSPAKDFQVDATGSAFQTDQVNLYNGNIRSVTTAMTDVANNPLEVLATTYRYDQLHRFKESHVFTASDITDLNSLINAQRQHLTTGTQNTLADREVHVDYDANGNIMKLDRRAYTPDPSTGGNNRMDEFDYDYTLNQLKQVADAVGSTSSLGYGDVQAGQAAGNYEYHADGTLKADLQEEIGYIDWTPDGKVRRIYRTATSEKPDVKIEYNAAGIRVYKIEMVKATGGALKPSAEWNYTWYALDATGNNWGVYRKTESKPALHKTEAVIFGSQRIGLDNREVAIGSTLGSTVTRQLGSKTYELSDYLGNVKEVISDRRLPETTVDGIAYQAKVVSYSDYYPFGMLMPGRNGEDVMAKYRYGSQGQEKDDEIKGKGNIANYKFRMQDTRIGRFFSIDPLAPKYPFYSPYSFSGNRLIDAIELEGLEPLLVKDEYGFPKIGDKFEAKYRLNLPNEDVVLIYQGYHGFVIFRNDRDKINSFYEYGYSATNGNIYDTHKEPYDNGKEITALVGVDGVSNINDYPENMFLTTRITAPSFIVYREKIEEGTYGMDNRDYLGNLIPASGFDEEEVVETYAFRFSVSVEDHLNTLKENASEEGATLENVIITLSINRNVSSEHRDLFERTVKEYFEGTAIVNFFLFDTTETDPAVLDDELNKIEADKVRVFSDVLEKL